MSFRNRVLTIVHDIKKGEVLTYKEVAMRSGSPRAARAVGMIMSKNHDPEVPCHRVVCSNGTLGGYQEGIAKKRALLEKEGAI